MVNNTKNMIHLLQYVKNYPYEPKTKISTCSIFYTLSKFIIGYLIDLDSLKHQQKNMKVVLIALLFKNDLVVGII